MEKAGGHALEKHVGKTYDDLLLRSMRDINDTVTSFPNKRTAINAVKQNLKYNAEEISLWLMSNPSANEKKVLNCIHDHIVGDGIIKGKKGGLKSLSHSKVVIVTDTMNDYGFKIVTAYPHEGKI
jgi:hypothetical protein